MRISALKHWIYKPYAKTFLTKGLESLKFTCNEFLFASKIMNNQEIEIDTHQKTPTTADSANDMFFGESEDENSLPNEESLIFKRNKEIENEISFFSSILSDQNIIKSTQSTSSFWKRYKNHLPKLFDLSVILLNISSSGAIIERFFSISGVVCDLKRSNMTEDLIIMRSMLKTNMHVLTELNETSF